MKNFSLFLFVFSFSSIAQVQIGKDINGEAPYDFSGSSVSLSSDGNVVAIGAPHNDGNGASTGHVRIYQNKSGTWTQIGKDIDGEPIVDPNRNYGDQSGSSVSLSSDGSVVAIGAPYNQDAGLNAGHVRVYKNQSGTWLR